MSSIRRTIFEIQRFCTKSTGKIGKTALASFISLTRAHGASSPEQTVRLQSLDIESPEAVYHHMRPADLSDVSSGLSENRPALLDVRSPPTIEIRYPLYRDPLLAPLTSERCADMIRVSVGLEGHRGSSCDLHPDFQPLGHGVISVLRVARLHAVLGFSLSSARVFSNLFLWIIMSVS